MYFKYFYIKSLEICVMTQSHFVFCNHTANMQINAELVKTIMFMK